MRRSSLRVRTMTARTTLPLGILLSGSASLTDGRDDVADRGDPADAAAEGRDRLDPPGAGVVGDLEHRAHLDHWTSPPGPVAGPGGRRPDDLQDPPALPLADRAGSRRCGRRRRPCTSRSRRGRGRSCFLRIVFLYRGWRTCRSTRTVTVFVIFLPTTVPSLVVFRFCSLASISLFRPFARQVQKGLDPGDVLPDVLELHRVLQLAQGLLEAELEQLVPELGLLGLELVRREVP